MKISIRFIRKIILIFIFISIYCEGLGQNLEVNFNHKVDDIFRYTFEEDKSYYIFTIDANVREAPITNSKVVDVLYAGDPIKVVEITDKTLALKGIIAVWLKISYLKNGIEMQGYLWQALVSQNSFVDGYF